MFEIIFTLYFSFESFLIHDENLYSYKRVLTATFQRPL